MCCRYAVGVYDKRTNKIQFHDAQLVHFDQTINAVKMALADSQLSMRKASILTCKYQLYSIMYIISLHS